ncbi:hypothetical protein LBMAG46_33030 [Planctomycetia bacterium]|nr:hypothetical protein LBMAG46_33030 [Planctomycetia bacterium]
MCSAKRAAFRPQVNFARTDVFFTTEVTEDTEVVRREPAFFLRTSSRLSLLSFPWHGCHGLIPNPYSLFPNPYSLFPIP